LTPARAAAGKQSRGAAAPLFDHELLVVTGKGGVGKTTVSAALAVAAARRGLRTIVAEVSARDDVTRTLGREDAARDREVELEFGVHHTSIEPQAALRDYLDDQLPSPVAELLSSSRAFTYLTAATPGLRELLTVGKVWELAQETRRRRKDRSYDLVILDAPASGHGIAVLTAPATFARTARVGRIARQAATIDALVTDARRTAVIAVARPEELPVNETLQLERALESRTGLTLDLAVANRVSPRRFSAAEAGTLDNHGGDVVIDAARRRHLRSRSEHAQVARLRRGLSCPVVGLHDLFHPALDAEAIAELASDLERAL
jgi:anion-transporting  ArsA/GET3 family ATPase